MRMFFCFYEGGFQENVFVRTHVGSMSAAGHMLRSVSAAGHMLGSVSAAGHMLGSVS